MKTAASCDAAVSGTNVGRRYGMAPPMIQSWIFVT
jgi:hypothetical protein